MKQRVQQGSLQLKDYREPAYKLQSNRQRHYINTYILIQIERYLYVQGSQMQT